MFFLASNLRVNRFKSIQSMESPTGFRNSNY